MILDAFAQYRKAPISFVVSFRPPDRSSVCTYQIGSRRTDFRNI